MRIASSPINFITNFQQRIAGQKPSLQLRPQLACDCVSFGAYIKKTLPQEIEKIGEENIPEPVLTRAKEIIAKGNKEGVSLYDVHEEYYAPLADVETLEEAKNLYPEFTDIKQIKDLKFRKGTTCYNITQGNIKGFTPENATLVLLQHVYCGNQTKKIKTLGQGSYPGLKTTLEIPTLNKVYATYINSTRQNQNSDFRKQASERMKAQRQDVAFNEKSLVATRENLAKMHADPDYRRRHIERTKAMHLDPEYAANRDEYLRLGREKMLADPALVAKRINASIAKCHEFDQANIQKEAMSRAMTDVWASRPEELQDAHKEFAKDFPRLGPILTKKRAGEALDEGENEYLALYYKAFYETYPEVKVHLSDNVGDFYKMHYWQVKDEYEAAKNEGRLEELLKSWKAKESK